PLLSAKYAVIALRGAQAFLWCVVWVLVSSGLWKVGAVFFAAAGVGNFVSFLYPPYGVVDFMWSSLLNRAIGMGVFNAADVMWLLGIGAFILAGLRAGGQRIHLAA